VDTRESAKYLAAPDVKEFQSVEFRNCAAAAANTARDANDPPLDLDTVLQGWENAPNIVRACHQTLRTHNPNWEIRALSRNDVARWLDGDALLSTVEGKTLEPETYSDVIRIALLRRYGGDEHRPGDDQDGVCSAAQTQPT
jgi:hypothetical protein